MVAHLEEQPIQQHVIKAFRRRQCLCHALSRLLVKIQSDGSEGEIEIDDRCADVHALGDAPSDIVRQCRTAHAPATAYETDHPSNGWRIWIEIQSGNHLDEMQGV